MAKAPIFNDVIPETCTKLAEEWYQDPGSARKVFQTLLWCVGNVYPVTYKDTTSLKYFCPGTHLDYNDNNYRGPRDKADVMLVTPYPQPCADPESRVVPLAESSIEYLNEIGTEVGIDVYEWYATSLVKFDLPVQDMKSIPTGWKKECAPWLYNEVLRVEPKYIIALGSHVLKFFFGAQATLDGFYGKLHDFTFEYSYGKSVTVKVLALPAISSNEEAREESYARMINQLRVLYNEQHGIEVIRDYRHLCSEHADELHKEVDRVIVNNQNVVAIDLEWEGDYPGEPGAYIISFQFSTKPGEAFCCFFNESEKEEQVRALKKLLTPHDGWVPRIGGHFLRADMPWVLSLFKDDPETQEQIEQGYYPANTWQEQKEHGGWDTSLMYHAYKEDAKSYGLKNLAECILGVPKWDSELEAYKDDYIKQHKMRKGDLKGYGCIPRSILGPYGCWDADATRRLAELCMFGYNGHKALLDADLYGNSCWEPFWRAHAATPGLLEMEKSGLAIDKERLINLACTFDNVYKILLDDFRGRINWESFNPASSRDKQGLLFGREYTKSVTQAGTKYSMPEDAISLNLTPLYTTGDKVDWDKAVEDEDWGGYMPAADAMTLSILSQESPLVRELFDICKLGNTLRSNIRPPVHDEDGNITFTDGIYKYLHVDDNKVHTHLRQLLKTGRLSSSAPNLQNISKSAEENIQRILGREVDGQPTGDYLDILMEPRYLYPMRTIITADPDWYFLESDFTGAELAVMAWISGDATMMEHVRRNALPESDPDFYDMHSNMAVAAFRLDCEPTKHGLKSIGKKHLRVAAKAVVFGIPYGRGAAAIQKQCKSLGADLTLEEVQGLINHYFELYPGTRVYLNACKAAVTEQGFVASPWNRYRRFSRHLTDEAVAKYGREACNAPIQSTVADSVNMALWKLYNYRKEHPELNYKLCMQIHDALLVACPKGQVKDTIKAIKWCMVEDNPITIRGQQFRFSIDTEVYHNWGEPLDLANVE